MIQKSSISLALAGFILSGATAFSQVIIDSTTLNGSFENGTDADAADWAAFDVTYTEERLANNASDGSWSMVMGYDDRAAFKLWGVSQNTGYTVSSGETFDLSFDWVPKYNWRTSDAFGWELYTSSGSIASGSVGGLANGANYQTVSLTGIGTVAAGNVGEGLWISFQTVDPGSYPTDPQGFARIDNVQLTAVPEPSTYALLGGFFALGFVLLRRRLRG